MKKFFKILLLILAVCAILLTAGCFALQNKKPNITKSDNANLLANKMLNAVNKTAWEEIKMINWTFSGRNSYLWNKQNNSVIYTHKKQKVILNISNKTGKAFVNGKEIKGEKLNKLIDKAYTNFCNDSWWLNPIIKVFDFGVERSLTDNKNQLMVEYNKGGVTPGDSYLWNIGENGLPTSYLMWTKILPIKGMEVFFEDWVTLENGAKIATSHIIDGLKLNVKITDLKIGNDFKDFGFKNNPFFNKNVKINNNINTTKSKK